MKRLLILLVATLAACGSSDSPASPDSGPRLTQAGLARHLGFLAADNMAGRRAGSEDELRAAEYVRQRFSDFGLDPGVPGYLQTFTISVPVGGVTGLESQNVVAVLPGKGELAGQWVIVGAHYDHLGVDVGSGVVFNGADDNASGTAMVLELARLLEAYYEGSGVGVEDRRSVMFHAYGAEEVGLTGSRHFCVQPTVSMDSVIVMLNFDMVGRMGQNGLFLLGTPSSEDWMGFIARANVGALRFGTSEEISDRSDHFCFYQRNKPILFFHTGLHNEYHTPSDDVRFIDYGGMVSIGTLAAELILDLVVTPDPPRINIPVVESRGRWSAGWR